MTIEDFGSLCNSRDIPEHYEIRVTNRDAIKEKVFSVEIDNENEIVNIIAE